jgi:hypothetical protein
VKFPISGPANGSNERLQVLLRATYTAASVLGGQAGGGTHIGGHPSDGMASTVDG